MPPDRPAPTRAEERIAEIDASPRKLLAEIERLEGERDAARAELEAAGRERDEYLAGLQRERAEFLNFKRRTAEERQASLGLAAESLILKVLDLADDFDRAIEARPAPIADDPWVEGVAAIDRKLRQLLESEGVRPIDASSGVAFDPREHEGVTSVQAAGVPDGHVVEELRRGYRLRDRVIRPALVAVAAGGGGSRAMPDDGDDAGRSGELSTGTPDPDDPTTAAHSADNPNLH